MGTAIGVVIPTFNRQAMLRQALESVLNQSHDALEIVVIDNASTDGTATYMAGVGDRRVRYVVNPQNIGMAGSINRAVHLLSPEVRWCTVLADDDFLAPDAIAALVNGARRTAPATIVDSHRVFVDVQSQRRGEALPAPMEQSAIEYLHARRHEARQTYLTGVLFRRDAFESLGGYPVFSSGLASDDALIFALALRDRLVQVASAVAYVRIHDEAESQTPRGALVKIRTMDEFAAYCRNAASAVPLEPPLRASFEQTLRVYAMSTKAHCWLAALWAAADGSCEFAPEELAALRARVRADPDGFTARVRLSAWLERHTGFDLESSRLRELGVFPLFFRGAGGKRRLTFRPPPGQRPA
jgi:glycosyltransferase involved in cell wall biosynthesis